MTKTPDTARRLSDAQFSALLELFHDVDSVELKTSVPADEHRATISGLPLDPVEAEPRQVFFFDTPDLALNRTGVVVRARRMPGGGADTVIKLRPVVPAELPDSIRHSGSFKVEVDIVPGGFVCSGSLKGKAKGEEVRAVAAGEMKLSQLLSKEQRAFYRQHAPRGLALDSLTLLGPTFALKSVFWPKQLGRKMVAEYWLYPDGSRLLELSTKCTPAESPAAAAETRSYLASRGVTISSIQQTKTRMALEFNSAQLKKVSQTPTAQLKRSRKTPAARPPAKRRAVVQKS